MIISLTGYMGSGKSLIAKKLHSKINFPIFDLDVEISKKLQQSIPDIFQSKGEIFFRKKERAVLEEVLTIQENIILSLGGGTPCYYDNIELLNTHSITVFLQAQIPTLVSRILPKKHQRPLVAHIPEKDLPEFIAKHLFERNTFYQQAQIHIATDDKTPEEIAEEIIFRLQIK